MEMEPKFDLEKFRDRCVQEFCELKEKPTQVLSFHKSVNIKHYAPGMNDMQLAQWDSAQKHIIQQTDFAAPFVFKEDIAYGIIDIHRPLLVIKFGNECYWRAVPKRDAQACIEIAKAKNIYAKLRTVPLPKRTEIKEQTVESFIERIRLETLNPPPQCLTNPFTFVREDSSLLALDYHWDQSATSLKNLILELFKENLEVVKYYLAFPHVAPEVREEWVVIEHEEKQDFYIEYRLNSHIFIKKAPDFIKEQLKQYAKNKARLFLAPTFLRTQKTKSNLDYLKK
jgi:hypothetical protein